MLARNPRWLWAHRHSGVNWTWLWPLWAGSLQLGGWSAPAKCQADSQSRFLMCLVISSSSKLMTTANQTDVSAAAAEAEAAGTVAETQLRRNPIRNLRMLPSGVTRERERERVHLRVGFMSNCCTGCSCSLQFIKLRFHVCVCSSKKVASSRQQLGIGLGLGLVIIKLLETRLDTKHLPNRHIPRTESRANFAVNQFVA